MIRKSKKRILIVVAVVVGICSLYGVFCLSRGIVRRSYSMDEIIPRETKDTAMEERGITFDEASIADNIGTPLLLYNKKNVLERQINFLGKNYSKFKNLLNTVETNYQSVFESMNTNGNKLEVEGDYLELSIVSDAVRFGSFKDSQWLYFRDSLTVIGMYGDTCIVYVYRYDLISDGEIEEGEEPQIVVVDYSSMKIPTNDRTLYDFGDTKSLWAGNYKIEGNILYVKGT